MSISELWSNPMKIEKNVPPPDDPRPVVYPFARMTLGDSVTLDGEAGQSMAKAARSYSRRHPGWRCVTRTLDTGATRVWRIE
jgi:hypothetical protein